MELEHRHLDRHGEGRGLAAGVQSDQGRSGALGRVGLSLHPTEAIHELLMRTPMRLVQLPNAVQETELRPKLAVKMFGVVADYVQAAALVRTVRPERRDNHVAPGPDRAGDLPNICGSVACAGQEVEDGPVVPDIVASRFQLNSRIVAGDPMHRGGGHTQTGLRHVNRRRGDVEDRDVAVALRDEIIDQRRFSAAHVNDRAAGGWRRVCNEP